MRTHVLVAAVVAAVAAAAAPAARASSPNPQIAGLQVALREQGLYRGAIDAVSGPETVAAVRAFQRSHGLRVTGLVDARMRTALGPLGRPLFGARTLRHGDFGWDVAVLQFLLVRQGIEVPVNAYFDRPTLRGVRTLQRRLHLKADGVVGADTLASLVKRDPVPLARRRTVLVSRRTHVVKPGESLWVLAKRYHTTVAKLAKLNHLNLARPLLVGAKLRLPAARKIAVQPVADRTESVTSVVSLLDRWAAHYGVPARLARALAWMESGYNNSLVSSVGARGIMQIMPGTWQYVETVLIGRKVSHDASGNVRIGVAYLHHLLSDFGGNERLALAGWYQGEASVRQQGMLAVSRRFVADVLALQLRV